MLVDHLLKTKKEFENLKKQEIQAIFTKKELDKACFQHDMAYGDFEDLKRRTASDKVLRDKAFNIAKNLKYDGYQRGIASMFYKSFDKRSASLTSKSASSGDVNTEVKHTKQLAEELYKPIIRNF